MARCDLCGKKSQRSRSGKHKPGVAGKQWLHRAPKTLKISKPNVHRFWILNEKGQRERGRFCTKCLRIVREEQEELKKRLEAKKAKTSKK